MKKNVLKFTINSKSLFLASFLFIGTVNNVHASFWDWFTNTVGQQSAFSNFFNYLSPCSKTTPKLHGPLSCILPNEVYSYSLSDVGPQVYNYDGVRFQIWGGYITRSGNTNGLYTSDYTTDAADIRDGQIEFSYPSVDIVWLPGNFTHGMQVTINKSGIANVCGARTMWFEAKMSGIKRDTEIKLSDSKLPTCSDGSFKFTVPYLAGVSYEWTLPEGWKIDGSGKNTATTNEWNNTITGTANNNKVGGEIRGGELKVKVSSACASGIWKLASLPYQIVPNLTGLPEEVSFCSAGTTLLDPLVNISNKNDYSVKWNTWSADCPNFDCKTFVIKDAMFASKTTVSAVVTHLANGCSKTFSTNVIPFATNTTAGWASSKIFANSYTETESGGVRIDKNEQSLVTDLNGNAYYVSSDKKIYTYRYTGEDANYPWKNYTIAPAIQAQGALHIESNYRQTTLYYVDNTTTEVNYIYSLNNGSTWSSPQNLGFATNQIVQQLKVSSTGDVFQVAGPKGNSYLYKQGTKYLNFKTSSLGIYTNRIYFANENDGNKITCLDNALNIINLNIDENLRRVAQEANIAVDAYGNVYYTAINGEIVKIRVVDNRAVNMNNTAIECSSGFISVNPSTRVVYFVATDFCTRPDTRGTNIFQLYANDASDTWFTTRKLTRINDAVAYGTVAFRSPNVFYVSPERNIKMISYNTANGCKPSVLRSENADPEAEIARIEESKPLAAVQMYPNPATDNLTILFNNAGEQIQKVRILSLQGALVKEIASIGTMADINISDITPGMYMIQVLSTNEAIFTQKIEIK